MKTFERKLSKINVLWFVPLVAIAHLLFEPPVSLVLMGIIAGMAISIGGAYARSRQPQIGIWVYPILWTLVALTVPMIYNLMLTGA